MSRNLNVSMTEEDFECWQRLEKLVEELLDTIDFECSICLSGPLEGVPLFKIGTCEHVYHLPCIGKWIEIKRTTCPMCRKHISLNDRRRLIATDGSSVEDDDDPNRMPPIPEEEPDVITLGDTSDDDDDDDDDDLPTLQEVLNMPLPMDDVEVEGSSLRSTVTMPDIITLGDSDTDSDDDEDLPTLEELLNMP